MKKLLFLLLLFPVACFGQRGFQMVDKSTELGEYEKYIKDTICNYCVYDNDKGYIPTAYQWVEYNYGEPPPSQFDIARCFFTIDSICRGWTIRFDCLSDLHGYTEGIKSYLVTSVNNEATFFSKVYLDTLDLSYGMREYDLKITIKSALKK